MGKTQQEQQKRDVEIKAPLKLDSVLLLFCVTVVYLS